MASEIDGLTLKLGADFSDLDRALAGLDKSMMDLSGSVDANLGQAFDAAGHKMAGALDRFARDGSLSFTSLRSVGLKAAGDIAASFLDLGLKGIGLGGAPVGSGGFLTSLISGIFGRAGGGPVSAGVPYMVGERGPELFVPRAPGRIASRGFSVGGQGGTQVTVNVYGAQDSGQLRQSAGQVAAAVAAAVKRGQRNL